MEGVGGVDFVPALRTGLLQNPEEGSSVQTVPLAHLFAEQIVGYMRLVLGSLDPSVIKNCGRDVHPANHGIAHHHPFADPRMSHDGGGE